MLKLKNDLSMLKFLRILSILAIILFLLPGDADAQSRRKKKKKKPAQTEQTSKLTDKLWYGGGFALGFGSGGAFNLAGNEFQFGLSPMAGYKVFDWLSVGPRVEFAYLNGRYRFPNSSEVYKLNSISYAVGPFMRLKSPWNIFAHVEYSYMNIEYTDFQILPDNKLRTFREGQDAFYLGAGYNSSGFGRWGYEFYIVYDVLAPDNSVNLPFDYRFGITYNF